MVKWDDWLSWQAQVTDAIDREEQEIKTYQALEKWLLVRRDHALQSDQFMELQEIDSHLANVKLLVKMKTLLIKQWEAQFRMAVQTLFS